MSELENRDGKQHLTEIREKKLQLIREARKLEKTREQFRMERDEKNRLAQELFKKAKEQRKKRDKLNQDVARNKQMRNHFKEQIDEILKELRTYEDEEKNREKSSQTRNKHAQIRAIKTKIRKLEEKIETSPNLSKDEEIEILESFDRLEQELIQLTEKEDNQKKIAELRRKLRHARLERRTHDATVKTLAQQSQQYHNEMVRLYQEAHNVRIEADELHRKIIALNEQIKQIRKQIQQKTKEITFEEKKLNKQLDEKALNE